MTEAETEAAKADLAPGDEFNQERWMKQMTLLANTAPECDIEVFCYFFNEICNLFKLMSKAMYIAFHDISTKAKTIIDNRDHYAANHNGQAENVTKSLQAFILMEIEEEIHTLNGKTNSQTITDKTSWQYTYASTARTALRDMWLLDYVTLLLKDIRDFPEKTMREVSKNAYEVALAPHHPWLIRNIASVAVAAVPSKEDFLEKTGCDIKQIGEAVEKLTILKEKLWAFYKEHGIDQLD